MSLRICYIGAGNFSNSCMFPQLSRHGLELAAICDLDEKKALAVQRRYGFKNVYTDFRKMLETERPQAVFCVGGPKVHYEVGREVLDRGFPLYIQKPPAPSAAATREMAEIAAKRTVVCHVGFNIRTSPAARQAKTIIQSAEFGTPLAGVFRYGLCYGKTLADAVMDQHCHMADLARFFLGQVKAIKVVKSGIPEARDYVVAVRFESGAVGSINFTSGQIPEKEFIYFEITGRGSFLYCHDCNNLTWRRPFKGPWWKEPQADYVFNHGSYGGDPRLEVMGYIGDVANYIAAVKGEEPDSSSIASTIGTMELCEEILRQLQQQ